MKKALDEDRYKGFQELSASMYKHAEKVLEDRTSLLLSPADMRLLIEHVLGGEVGRLPTPAHMSVQLEKGIEEKLMALSPTTITVPGDSDGTSIAPVGAKMDVVDLKIRGGDG